MKRALRFGLCLLFPYVFGIVFSLQSDLMNHIIRGTADVPMQFLYPLSMCITVPMAMLMASCMERMWDLHQSTRMVVPHD